MFQADSEDNITIYQTKQEVNKYYMKAEVESLMFGIGPAIRLDKDLFHGESNVCETYNSPILIKNGEKYVNDMFEAKNTEVFLL